MAVQGSSEDKSSPADLPTIAETVALTQQPSGPETFKLKDRYQVERELGRGGFGVVYLARDEQLHNRHVVVKVLLDRASDSEGWFTRKFREETEALSRLDHPGVVGVLDAGEMPDGKPFLVMQFVDGVTLRQAMRNQKMPLERVGNIVRRIGQALSAAHDRSICHRDLKPENIMLQDVGDGEDVVKIIDFGIATVRELQAATAAEQTRVAGSAPYMAPEQLLGKPCSGSDIYALGVIAYELVTGQRPFKPESLTQMYLLQQEGVKIKPVEMRPDLPSAAEACILRALAVDVDRRYQRARDFGDEFARALSLKTEMTSVPERVREPDPVPAAKPPARRTALFAGLAAAAVALAGAGFFLTKKAPTPPAVPDSTFSYSITAQRYRDNKYGEPFLLPGEMLFGARDRIRLDIGNPQPGFFYLLNEGPVQRDGLPSFNVMFPGAGQSAGIPVGKTAQIPPAEDWITLDEQEGVEKLWMVWSVREVPEMEKAKTFGRAETQGAVTDESAVREIQGFLAKHQGSAPAVEKDEKNQKTHVRGKGDILVRLMNLQHR